MTRQIYVGLGGVTVAPVRSPSRAEPSSELVTMSPGGVWQIGKPRSSPIITGIPTGTRQVNRIGSVTVTGTPASSFFLPSNIATCNSWWRADLGITLTLGLVTAWADQTANGHNLGASQGIAPGYNTTGLGGQACLTFAGSGTQWMQATGWTDAQPRTDFIVYKTNSNTAGALFDSANGAARNDAFFVTGSHLALYAGTQVNTDLTLPSTGTACVLIVVWNGSSSFARLNRTQSANVNPNTQSRNGVNLAEPAPGGTGSLNGSVAEFAQFTGALTAGEMGDLEDYVNRRYGI